MIKWSIIIPIYNENVHEIDLLSNYLSLRGHEVIIVDDGSQPEFEPSWLGEMGECNRPRVLRKNKNEGYGAAIKTGVFNAHGKNIAIIDGDEQYSPDDLFLLMSIFEQDHIDMLIGRRVIHQGGVRRFWGRMFIKAIASICAGRYIPDLNSGLRVFSRHLALSYEPILCNEFSFTTSLTLCMLLDKYKVRWYDIDFSPRNGSRSTVKIIKHGLITVFYIFYITLGLRTRRIRECLRKLGYRR